MRSYDPAMEIRVLGALELRAEGEIVPVRRGRPRALLISLILRRGDRVSADTLIEELWGDKPPRNAVNALQILVSYLRRALSVGGEVVAIETVAGGYRLRAPDDALDATRFERAVAAATAAPGAEERLRLVDAALRLWRGSPLPEVAFQAYAQGEISRLDALRMAALELRAQSLVDVGRVGEAVVELQQLATEHPLHERFHAQLMTALYRTGRQAEALSVYDRARTDLVEQLGVDPGPELQSLWQAILRQDPALDAPHMTAAPPATASREPAVSSTPPSPRGPPAVPQPLTSLVGRAAELEELDDLIRQRRLLTLTGPGGAGKTRIALELQRRRQSPGAVWWVDASAVSAPESFLGAVATAVGVPTDPDDDITAFVARLSGREGLLVLDTCERLLEVIRRFVTELLQSAPAIRVLATSRRPLGVPTELTWPVPPLSVPAGGDGDVGSVAAAEAVQLFVERASDVLPGFALTPDNAPAVAQICRLLDGLPLAVELAAAHAGVLDVTKMVGVLDDRLRLLVDDTRGDRQQTLRATIAWSHQLLDDDEAKLFARLGIFAGPFVLEAGLLVAGEGLRRDPLDVLLSLTRQSLVSTAGTERYRLLDTVRAFAIAKMQESPDDAAATAARHAEWLVDFVAEASLHLRGPDASGWSGEINDALPDIRAALTWLFDSGRGHQAASMVAQLSWFWAIQGSYEEAVRWLDRSKAVADLDPVVRAHVLAGAGMHAASTAQFEAAIADLDEAARIYDHQGRPKLLGHALIYLGVAHWSRGDDDRAAQVHDRGVAQFRMVRDDWGLALCLSLRARTALQRDEADVEDLLDAAAAAARRSQDRHIVALCMDQQARFELARARPTIALELAEESLELSASWGYQEGVIASHHTAGLASFGLGRFEEARGHHATAVALAHRIGHAGGLADGLDGLAVVAVAEGHHEAAAALLAAANEERERFTLRRTAPLRDLVAEAAETAHALLPEEAWQRAVRQGLTLDPTGVPALLGDSAAKGA
jgi:predicted ATPase/DNA-binding SARP family transcriptional activator